MLRSVKYGLYGAVLAGVVGGSVAWTNVDKTVTLVIDGQSKKVHTTAASVGGVLETAGYDLNAHDLVAPGLDVAVREGSTIVFRRGRLLHLDVDGARRDVWTTAPTVAEALAQLGYSSSDFSSVSRSTRLPLTATDITVRTPKLITVVVDGRKRQVSTTARTVADLLDDLGITLGARDTVSARPSSVLDEGEAIVIRRVLRTRLNEDTPIPFKTKVVKDATLSAGRTQVVKPGKNGLARLTYAAIYIDGKLAGRTLLKSVVLRAPVTQVVKLGTKPRPSISAAQAQAIAKPLAAELGWTGRQWDCLVTLWSHESGWRVHAENRNTGAYGIPQALPGSKMGPGWQDDATVQITWGLNYIHDRYGTPCDAWSYWNATGWY